MSTETPPKKLSHRELVIKTAAAQDFREWMVFTEPTFGANSSQATVKPDVLMIKKSWSRYDVRILECKVTQSDLEQDVKKLKFEKYFAWSDRVSFVLAAGLDDSCLEGHPVGIIKQTKNGFHTKRSAPLIQGDKFHRSWTFFMPLLMNHDCRYLSDGPLNEAIQERDALILASLKSETHELYRIKSEEFKALIAQAKESSLSEEEIRRQIERRYHHDLYEKLSKDGHYNPVDTVKHFLESTIRSEMHDTAVRIRERFAEFIEAVNYKHGEAIPNEQKNGATNESR